ncbi:LysR family transcriptional regulator [Vibrio sp. HN007]|uniref:LysR family transcriptional regulator n=1 Tax=Vibrio iocasae TaxID=3098914 RepID=UPI0035D44F1E
MISVDNMMVFASVAGNRSFTKAAEELGMGKARVSQIVSQLEKELGVRLLHRTTRSLSLSDAGAGYYDKCRLIKEISAQANSEIVSEIDEPSGVVRLSAPHGNEIIANLLSEFLHKYPKIKLDMVEDDSYSDLIESRCDVAIRASAALEDSRLYAVKIGEFEDILCATQSYIDKTVLPEQPQDLLKLDWVSHGVVHGTKQLTLKSDKGSVTRVNMEPRVLVRNTNSMIAFINQDIGFGIMPSFMVKDELESGKFVRLLPESHGISIPFYAVYQDKTYMPLRVRVLIEFLRGNERLSGN